MPVYKVSIVVADGSHPGAILNLKKKPVVGKNIELNGKVFIIKEIIELTPARGKFRYLHLTCLPKGN